MKTYTKIRRFYATVGFATIIILTGLIAFGYFTPKQDSERIDKINTCLLAYEKGWVMTPENRLVCDIYGIKTVSNKKTLSTTSERVSTVYEPNLDNQDTFIAFVTGYNTVEEQTDSTPCISASGENICGRDDTLACPRAYEFGTRFLIEGKEYECVDRLSKKLDARFDINCDKDMECPYRFSRLIAISRLN